MQVDDLRLTNDAILCFEGSWKRGLRCSIDRIIEQSPPRLRETLAKALAATELQLRTKIGEEPRVEEYLESLLPIVLRPNSILELIQAECDARMMLNEVENWVDHYRSRFPELAGRITWSFLCQLRDGMERPKDPIASLPCRLGPYHVERVLGRGSFGVVYQGRRDDDERIFALKVPHGGPNALDMNVYNLFRQKRYADLFLHRGVVPVIESAIDPHSGIPYIVFPKIEGLSLEQQLRLGRTFSPVEAARYVVRICEAIAAAHDASITHRDIKPANILQDDDGNPLIIDFGLALRPRDLTDQITRMRDSGENRSVAGTLPYMPPECVEGTAEVHASMDIYSIGVILYQLLTRQLPFPGSPEMMKMQIKNVNAIEPSRFTAGLPPELDALCLKALAKNPKSRPKSAAKFAADLAAMIPRLVALGS